MLKNLSRAAALATVLGSLALASPSFAAPFNNNGTQTEPPNSSVDLNQSGQITGATPDTAEPGTTMQQGVQQRSQPRTAARPYAGHHMAMKNHSPESMRERVEHRIKTLHDKLHITKAEEPQWNDVAQAMRDSEANVVSLIQERRQNAHNMNAVDDLESYQKIAQAHADGLQKVAAAFATLYGSMSDAQKKNADMVFGSYEGRMMGHHHGRKHK